MGVCILSVKADLAHHKSYLVGSFYNSCECISWSANTALQKDSLFFCFTCVPECQVWHDLTYLTPVQRRYSPTGRVYSGLGRANGSPTCLSSQSVGLSWPLGRGILCASLSLYRPSSAVRLVNITVSFSLRLHRGWQPSIQTNHHASLSEEKTSTQIAETLELWEASFNA